LAPFSACMRPVRAYSRDTREPDARRRQSRRLAAASGLSFRKTGSLDVESNYAPGNQLAADRWRLARLDNSYTCSSVKVVKVQSDSVARSSALYDRVRRVIPPIEWPAFADDIDAILDLKRRRNAVVLGHNYQTPEIFHCVADFVADSLALARMAMKAEAEVIVLAGVHFMAETAKLLNPEKTVLLPDEAAGCSLAGSITPEDVRLLRQRYPGVPIVTYVNTSAAVKAESDVCCTSSNAKAVVESLAASRVILLPDEYLARNVAATTDVEIIAWKGHCEVHERFTAADIRQIRESHPGVVVLAHPECPPEVIAEADFSGSTAAMSDYVTERTPRRVMLVTECSMSDNVAVQHPDLEFIRPCNLCPHMKRITLANIRRALEENQYVVNIDPVISARAKRAVERMLAV
jgi:quinolinate synthase